MLSWTYFIETRITQSTMECNAVVGADFLKQICEKSSREMFNTRVFQKEQEVPYAYGKTGGRLFWVGYDDLDSCMCKVGI